MSNKISDFNTRLEILNLPKKYIMFYHDIKGEDFYSGKLGSDERQARNINIVNIFSDIQKIIDFSSELFIQDIVKDDETKSLSLPQRLNYLILNEMYENFIVKLNLEQVIRDIKTEDESKKSLVLRNLVKECEEFSFLTNFENEEYINFINEYALINYPGYINFMMDVSFKYNLDQKNTLISLLFISNILFSLYSSIANIDKDLDLYICELTEEEFLHYINICCPDFQMSMNQDAAKENFPQYQIWKKMEVDFYKSVNNKKIDIFKYLTEILNPNSEIKNGEQINLQDLF